MNTLVVKLVPTALTLAAGAYIIWPYYGPGGGLPSAPRAAADSAELPQSLLQPKLPPPPVRDPFEDPEEKRLQARTTVNKRIDDLVRRIKESRKEKEKTASKGKSSGDDGQLAGLTLNATYTRSGKGAAVINGRVFQTGENVRPDKLDDACVLKEVRPYSVVLRQGGQDLVLKYTTASPTSRASTGAAKTAGSSGGEAASGGEGPKRPAGKRGKSKQSQTAQG